MCPPGLLGNFKFSVLYLIALRVHSKSPYCIIRFDLHCMVTWLPANRMVKRSSYEQSRTRRVANKVVTGCHTCFLRTCNEKVKVILL